MVALNGQSSIDKAYLEGHRIGKRISILNVPNNTTNPYPKDSKERRAFEDGKRDGEDGE